MKDLGIILITVGEPGQYL